jgi:LysM repeat protein
MAASMLSRLAQILCATLVAVASVAFVFEPHNGPPNLRAALSASVRPAHVPVAWVSGKLGSPGSVALGALTVRSGDTLSGLAAVVDVPWQALYETNRHKIGHTPDLIFPGQVLSVPPDTRAAMASYARHPYRPPAPPPVHMAASSSGGSTYAAPVTVSAGTGRTAFEQCVIARESGGNSQVMNASGHYGLYQFDLGTWVSGGGAAADFGHASVSEQQAVFASVYASRGTNPWAPYDGC